MEDPQSKKFEPATRATKTDARFRAIFGTTEEWTDYFVPAAVENLLAGITVARA